MSKERTEAQKEAARRNGAKSRGPLTAEGKAKVKENAVKLGLYTKRVVLANEDPHAWDDYVAALSEEWQPETLTEIELLHDLAAARWRLARILDYETALLDLEQLKTMDAFAEFYPGGDKETFNSVCWQALNKDTTLPAIHKQEARLRKMVREAMADLTAAQTRRRKEESAAVLEAEAEATAKAEDGTRRQQQPDSGTDGQEAQPDTASGRNSGNAKNKPEPPSTLPGSPSANVKNKPETGQRPGKHSPGRPTEGEVPARPKRPKAA